MAQPNGPRQKRTTGRLTQASTNLRTKSGTPPPPPLSPTAAAGFTNQYMGLQDSYTQALAAIRAQRGDVKGSFLSARADIKAQRIQGAVGAEANALQRGVLGSSADLGARASNIAAASGALVDARSAKATALGQLRIQAMQAGTTYQTGIGQLQLQQAAQQQELANQRFQQDMLAQQTNNYQKFYQAALKRLLAAGKNPAGAHPMAGYQKQDYWNRAQPVAATGTGKPLY